MPRKILHHGNLSGQFEPFLSNTDYYYFRHKPCNELAEIEYVLLDNQMRIIFNLRCRKCGFRDALKTVPRKASRKAIFKISPAYRDCIRKHWWDNL